MKTILCYGDSNTYAYDPRNGLRYPYDLRWTSILKDNLGKDYDVIVEGLSGRTTIYDRPDGAYKNGLPYLIPCIESHTPLDYIIFMLGTNDCNTDLNLDVLDIKYGMEKLVETVEEDILNVQEYMPKIIIVSPAAIGPNYLMSPFRDNLNEESVIKSHEIGKEYLDIAKRHNAIFLDCTDSLEVSNLDSEHLTIEGHKKLGMLLAKIIKNGK